MTQVDIVLNIEEIVRRKKKERERVIIMKPSGNCRR